MCDLFLVATEAKILSKIYGLMSEQKTQETILLKFIHFRIRHQK